MSSICGGRSFDDIRVREALGLVFDFEWINANLYNGLYKRTKSFFDDSELASTGRPADAAELALLAPFPGAVREDILQGTWRPAATDGSGADRIEPKRALALLKEAGYDIEGGRLTKAGEPLSFEIMVKDRNQERLALNYADSLARIGVTATVRQVDEVQYQRRRQKFDFDMMIGSWLASASPGNEQRSRWGSASAAQEASFNLAGVKSPAVDALINAMLAAKTHEEFVAAVRAYDRVLLSGFYIVPLFHSPDQWIAASTKLARPDDLAAPRPGLGRRDARHMVENAAVKRCAAGPRESTAGRTLIVLHPSQFLPWQTVLVPRKTAYPNLSQWRQTGQRLARLANFTAMDPSSSSARGLVAELVVNGSNGSSPVTVP